VPKILKNIEPQLVECSLPIFGFDLSSREYELNMARAAIEEMKVSHPDPRTSHVYGEWMSPKNSHHLNEKFKPLCDLVVDISTQIWCDIFLGGKEENAVPSTEFHIWQCWAIEYGDGGFAVSHNHFPSFFSCVLYLESDNESAPIVFGNGTARPAMRNAFYLFPGALQHEVPKNKGRRVAVAMNILKKNPDE